PDSGLVMAAEDILSEVGEVTYEWTIEDDRIRWGSNVASVLGVLEPDSLNTGRGYSALLDPSSVTNRHDAVLNATTKDDGGGVPYDIEYAFLPEGQGSKRRLILQDTGRWYGDAVGRPLRARGVVRIVNERHEREQRLAFLSRYDELTGY